ncbi:MAG: hypothetical protein AAF225_10705, partial [Pseudomonadota bacterium]
IIRKENEDQIKFRFSPSNLDKISQLNSSEEIYKCIYDSEGSKNDIEEMHNQLVEVSSEVAWFTHDAYYLMRGSINTNKEKFAFHRDGVLVFVNNKRRIFYDTKWSKDVAKKIKKNIWEREYKKYADEVIRGGFLKPREDNAPTKNEKSKS